VKQKYTIIKDLRNKELIIREFAELDKETLSLLCEETYASKAILTAMKAGKNTLIASLRTNNLYPPNRYIEKIADSVIDLYKSEDVESLDLFFDDIELLTRKPGPAATAPETEDESTDLDEMLEEDFDDTFEEKNEIKKLDSSLKIADDDYSDVDDEN